MRKLVPNIYVLAPELGWTGWWLAGSPVQQFIAFVIAVAASAFFVILVANHVILQRSSE
jgi:hypothetical protein